MFDGVHVGHRAVIHSAVTAARDQEGVAGILTFDPHPSRLLHPDDPTLLIYPRKVKSRLLRSLEVSCIIWQRFTERYRGIGAEGFVEYLHHYLPDLQSIHVGENFRYGAGRKGDAASLADSAQELGITVISVGRRHEVGQPVSSSRIRETLARGDMKLAGHLLGAPYTVWGGIEDGRKLGRSMGFPTLNVPWEPELLPPFGVYRARVMADGGNRGYPAVANYGVRPTVSKEARLTPVCEAHVLEECPIHAGETVGIELLEFLRPEREFPDLESLREQIARDVELVRNWFNREDGKA